MTVPVGGLDQCGDATVGKAAFQLSFGPDDFWPAQAIVSESRVLTFYSRRIGRRRAVPLVGVAVDITGGRFSGRAEGSGPMQRVSEPHDAGRRRRDSATSQPAAAPNSLGGGFQVAAALALRASRLLRPSSQSNLESIDP